MLRNCNHCATEYTAEQRYLSRGQGLYCSRSCSAKANTLARKPQANVTCAHCGENFYKSPSKLAQSASGLYFCKRACKDAAQRIGGLSAIQPAHYGISLADYRQLAFENYPHKCKVCEYDKYPEVLEVNHIDCDRSNNSLDNLEILCPTCHVEYHFLTKTGRYASGRTKTSKATSPADPPR
jgi:hypothetical protein